MLPTLCFIFYLVSFAPPSDGGGVLSYTIPRLALKVPASPQHAQSRVRLAEAVTEPKRGAKVMKKIVWAEAGVPGDKGDQISCNDT